MAAARSRLPSLLAITAAGCAGYYFYRAGGRVEGAEKAAEADLRHAAAKVRSRETDAEGAGVRAGAKLDSAVAEANKQYRRAEDELKSLGHDAKARINEMDKTIEDDVSKAKSKASSWWRGS